MKKNKGFILIVTTISLLMVSTIFYLLSLSLRKKINFNSLEQQSNIKELDLSNSYSTALYEFSLIDKYIVEGTISSKESYILNTPSGEKIWATNNSRNSQSIGGFFLSTIEPEISTISFSGNYKFTFELLKKINLTDENLKPFLDVYIYTNPFYLSCFLDKKSDSLLCEDSNLSFNNFRCLGEVISLDSK